VKILAIDQGTSATKAVVFGEDGDVVTSVESAVTPKAVPGGGVEQDPEQLWESVCEAGRQAVARAGQGVAAVGFANQGETVLAWDRKTGRPLSTAISWQDRRAAAICHDMAGSANALTRTTGLPLDPYFAAPKMTWLRRNVTGEGVVTTSDAWLLHRLTGSYVTDVTTASRTLLLDLGTRTWSEEACAAFGLDAATLPEVVASAQVIGPTYDFLRFV
jgi:glycerol kinase